MSPSDGRRDNSVVRHYRLMSRCSSKHVRITARHVDADAHFSDIYGQSPRLSVSHTHRPCRLLVSAADVELGHIL